MNPDYLCPVCMEYYLRCICEETDESVSDDSEYSDSNSYNSDTTSEDEPLHGGKKPLLRPRESLKK